MQGKARELLVKYFGYSSFKEGQEEIIDSILNRRDTLCIMPTGGGKSVCYQVPALVFSGTTLVISPLISLMKDQADALDNLGVPATFINSSLSSREVQSRLREVSNGSYKLLYVAPERLQSEAFNDMLNYLQVSLVAVDEAHCVSQWGHDFRPSYLAIAQLINGFQERPVVAAFTATATGNIRRDIINQLALQDPFVYVAGFDRPNLHFSVIKGENKKDFLHRFLVDHDGHSGIVYAATRKDVENLCEFLSGKGFEVDKYHAGLSDEERIRAQEDFIHDNVKIIVATNAFGMGIDKSNVRYVVHYNMPKNMESYYQEAGRAGRDGEKGECVLLFSPQDIQIQKRLIEYSSTAKARREMEYKKLQNMVDYCHTSSCLRKYILSYFGEEGVSDNCGNCGNCREDFQLVDITVDAQKVLSCLWRIRENYGVSLVSAVLKGSRSKKVLQLGFDRLSTYGLLSSYSTKDIKELINILISEGYITVTSGDYPVLKIPKKAYPVLKGKNSVYKKVFKEKEWQLDDELFRRLSRLRKELAQEAGVPPYMVFHDVTLREMSERCPSDKRSLGLISGVGEAKLERFGEAFLAEIRSYIDDNNCTNSQVESYKEITNDCRKIVSQTEGEGSVQQLRDLALNIGNTGSDREKLPQLFNHPDYEVRRRACSAACKLEDESIVRHILPCLYAEEPQVRQYALKAVLSSNCNDILGHVKEVLAREDKSYNIKLCEEILK